MKIYTYSVRSPFCYGRAYTRMKVNGSGRYIENVKGSSLWSVHYGNGSCLGYMTYNSAVRWLAQGVYPKSW